MRATFHYSPGIEHQDLISASYRGKSVGNHNRRATGKRLIECTLHRYL